MSQSEPTETDLDATTAAETYGDYSVDDEDQPVGLDNLTDVEGDVEDELDRGYSPPEKYSPAQGYGNTPYEEATGESLDQRIAQEVPEPDPYTDVPTEDLDDDEVGDERAGRLVTEQHVRSLRDSPGNRNSLLLAAG